MNCIHAVQMLPSRTLGPAEVKQWCTHQHTDRMRSAVRILCMCKGYDLHAIWYRATPSIVSNGSVIPGCGQGCNSNRGPGLVLQPPWNQTAR